MTADDSGGAKVLEFGVLGPLEVLRSGTRLHLGGRQQRAILALLVCEADKVVSVGRLADALWGDHPPAGFLTTVQTYIFHLRELLEPERERGAAGRILVTEAGGGYRLHTADASVDALVFEDLVARGEAALEGQDAGQAVALFDRALKLWRGEVLSDLAEFGFVAPVAGRLQEMRMSAMESRIDAELVLGHHGAAVAELDRLVADNPLRERLHAERMLALYRSGRQSDALEAYRRLRTLLHEELGIEPSPPLQTLHRAILAQDPTLAWYPLPAMDAWVGDGHAPEGAQNGSPRQMPAAVGQRSGTPGRRIRSKAVVVWSVAALVAAGGLTTAIVTLSGTGPGALPANSVAALGSDGSITGAVPVGTNPAGLASGGGALWVANRSEGSVMRIDPKTRTVVQKLPVGAAPEALTATADNVWVANRDGTVTRINITASKVVGDPIKVGALPAAIASGPSGVWVANSGDNTIQRIDPITGRAGKTVAVGDGPSGIAVDADSVWVANARDGTVSRIDPKTGAEISGPIRVGSGPRGIAVSGNDVWVANQLSASVSKINRSTGHIGSIAVGDGPTSVVVAHGSVWVSEQFAGKITRIDMVTGVTESFPIDSSPWGLAVVDDRVWVAAGAFTSPSHKGGTLTVAAQDVPGTWGIDPAEVYDVQTTQPQRLVYDGLVALRYASADSQVPVPNLALEVPEPSNGGRTYTFTLRPGIKYSTGREIKASDLVLGVQRALTLKDGNPGFFAGIVGGQHCIKTPRSCDLSAGVVHDDATRRVTFHLTSADPEFLFKLTMFVFPTPPGTSMTSVTTPLPGTGPYMITDYTRGKAFTLVRNPYFKRWSFAAQPDGYPDVIRWLKVADDRAGADAVIEGRADVARVNFRPDRRTTQAQVDELMDRYPDRVHSLLGVAVWYGSLNATVPPFNNIKARQAFNYAVDRNKLVELYGGPSVARATCQLLPPSFPSYSPSCPYTTGPKDGLYHGPDLKKALELVEASGTKGMPVTVHGVAGRPNAPLNAYLKQRLGQLGYKANLHEMPDAPASYDFLYDPSNKLQVTSDGILADFPLASNLYGLLAACGANWGGFCDRELDKRAAESTALRATDPAGALRAWTQIDRDVTDRAVIVPTFNTVDSWFFSERVKENFQSNPFFGPLLSQIWVMMGIGPG